MKYSLWSSLIEERLSFFHRTDKTFSEDFQKHDRSAYSLTNYCVFSNCIQRTATFEIMLAHEIITEELPHWGKTLFFTERTRPLARIFKKKHDRSAYSLTDYSVFPNCIQRTAKSGIMLAHEILTVVHHRGKTLFFTERTRPLVRIFKNLTGPRIVSRTTSYSLTVFSAQQKLRSC